MNVDPLEHVPHLDGRHIRENGPAAPAHVHQREWEFSLLLELCQARKPSKVLEIGSYEGGTLYHFLQAMPKGGVAVSVDDKRMGGGVDNRAKYQKWAPPGVKVVNIEGSSHSPEIVEQAAEYGPFDWIFIDADHAYPSVRKDWENYGHLAAPGGVVAFHDILGPTRDHPEIEVSRLWTEIRNRGYLTRELVADPDAAWGGIGIVYMPSADACGDVHGV